MCFGLGGVELRLPRPCPASVALARPTSADALHLVHQSHRRLPLRRTREPDACGPWPNVGVTRAPWHPGGSGPLGVPGDRRSAMTSEAGPRREPPTRRATPATPSHRAGAADRGEGGPAAALARPPSAGSPTVGVRARRTPAPCPLASLASLARRAGRPAVAWTPGHRLPLRCRPGCRSLVDGRGVRRRHPAGRRAPRRGRPRPRRPGGVSNSVDGHLAGRPRQPPCGPPGGRAGEHRLLRTGTGWRRPRRPPRRRHRGAVGPGGVGAGRWPGRRARARSRGGNSPRPTAAHSTPPPPVIRPSSCTPVGYHRRPQGSGPVPSQPADGDRGRRIAWRWGDRRPPGPLPARLPRPQACASGSRHHARRGLGRAAPGFDVDAVADSGRSAPCVAVLRRAHHVPPAWPARTGRQHSADSASVCRDQPHCRRIPGPGQRRGGEPVLKERATDEHETLMNA